MASSWVDLPRRWQLQDVQAALNVIICAVCAIATYCLVRFCWQMGTRDLRSRGYTRLGSLLTVNTIGEAWDVIQLLGRHIFHPANLAILIQCLLVTCFVIVTIFSGYIARYSTRVHEVTTKDEVSVYPASRNFDVIAYANNYWTNISESLEAANYPYDRLLDFQPDTTTHWVYEPDEWNTSWAFECEATARNPVGLEATGSCTNGDDKSIYDLMPGLYDVLNITEFNVSSVDMSGFWLSNKDMYQNMLLFSYGTNTPGGNAEGPVTRKDFSIASVYLQDIRKSKSADAPCRYAAGPVGEASYIRVDCTLNKVSDAQGHDFKPYPDSADTGTIVGTLTQNFQARFMMEAATNSTITQIEPQDLIRFYQVYMISKDTQFRQPVLRSLTIRTEIVQLHTALLAVFTIVLFFSLLALATWAFFMLTHDGSSKVPLSKIDWLMQAITSQYPSSNTVESSYGTIRCYPANNPDIGDRGIQPISRHHTDSVPKFESAVYEMELIRTTSSSWVGSSPRFTSIRGSRRESYASPANSEVAKRPLVFSNSLDDRPPSRNLPQEPVSLLAEAQAYSAHPGYG